MRRYVDVISKQELKIEVQTGLERVNFALRSPYSGMYTIGYFQRRTGITFCNAVCLATHPFKDLHWERVRTPLYAYEKSDAIRAECLEALEQYGL